jgi:hypothetical protein
MAQIPVETAPGRLPAEGFLGAEEEPGELDVVAVGNPKERPEGSFFQKNPPCLESRNRSSRKATPCSAAPR